jgi:hypothetical protein
MPKYQILIHKDTYQKASIYLKDLAPGKATTGRYFSHLLDDSYLTVNEFLERLINTKRPQIFAESAVAGDGSDWNQTELSILGDVGIAVPVTVFDDGLHHHPNVHDMPFAATLLYIPGALLRNGRGNTPADWDEVVVNGRFHPQGYYNLYERRLLPSFIYANDTAAARGKQAFITIPGLGCGQFAGKFHGQLGEALKEVLIAFLKKHGPRFPHIKAVYYDPYRECDNERHEIGHLSLMVRPLTKGNHDKPQLCQPEAYVEPGDDFSNCELFSFVAWDHVSWPGNDFYIGSRATDDGVKAAATSSMFAMTGVEGIYNPRTAQYEPPQGYKDWHDVVRRHHIQLEVKNNLSVLPV